MSEPDINIVARMAPIFSIQQYPTSIQMSSQGQSANQSRRGEEKKKIIFRRVHQFLWWPEDQATRWDDLGNVVAVQLSRLHQHQLPPYHHYLQFHNQFTRSISTIIIKTEPTIIDIYDEPCIIHLIIYSLFVFVFLVET